MEKLTLLSGKAMALFDMNFSMKCKYDFMFNTIY